MIRRENNEALQTNAANRACSRRDHVRRERRSRQPLPACLLPVVLLSVLSGIPMHAALAAECDDDWPSHPEWVFCHDFEARDATDYGTYWNNSAEPDPEKLFLVHESVSGIAGSRILRIELVNATDEDMDHSLGAGLGKWFGERDSGKTPPVLLPAEITTSSTQAPFWMPPPDSMEENRPTARSPRTKENRKADVAAAARRMVSQASGSCCWPCWAFKDCCAATSNCFRHGVA